MSDISLQWLEFADPLYGQNSRVVLLEGQVSCWLVDPGLPPATAEMIKFCSDKCLTPVAVMLTHAHTDHIAGVPEVLDHYPDLPVYLGREEWSFLEDPSQNLSAMTGVPLSVRVQELRDLVPGDSLQLGATQWEVRDTSGHSPGGRTLYCPDHKVALVGDALFAGSIGRFDFPHSDGARLLDNIRKNLLVLPGDTQVLCGHGPATTIADELRDNPYVGSRAAF